MTPFEALISISSGFFAHDGCNFSCALRHASLRCDILLNRSSGIKRERKSGREWEKVSVNVCVCLRQQMNCVFTCTRRRQYPVRNPRSTRGRTFAMRPNTHSDCIFGNRNDEGPASMCPCTPRRPCTFDTLHRTSTAGQRENKSIEWWRSLMVNDDWY